MVVFDTWALAAATGGYLEQSGWEDASLLAMARATIPSVALADDASPEELATALDANRVPLRTRTEFTSLIVHQGELRPRKIAVSERKPSRHANQRATAIAQPHLLAQLAGDPWRRRRRRTLTKVGATRAHLSEHVCQTHMVAPVRHRAPGGMAPTRNRPAPVGGVYRGAQTPTPGHSAHNRIALPTGHRARPDS